MLVRCPSCTKKLKVDDARLTTEGTKFKCPGCAALFLVRKPAAEAPPKPAPKAPVLEEKPVVPPPQPPPIDEEKPVQPPPSPYFEERTVEPPPSFEEPPVEQRPPVDEPRLETPPPSFMEKKWGGRPSSPGQEETSESASPPPPFHFDVGGGPEEQAGPQEEPAMGGGAREQEVGDQPAGFEFRLDVPSDIVSEGAEGTAAGSLDMPSSRMGGGEISDDVASFMSHTFVNQSCEEDLVSTEWGSGDSMQGGLEGSGPAGMDEMGGRGFMEETIERDASLIQNPFDAGLGNVLEERSEVTDTTVIDLPAAVSGGLMEEVPPPPVETFAGIPEEEIERARRLARTIMSDIALYNPRKVEEAIRSETFYEVMSDDLREGMKLYNSRIPPEVRAMSDFYREAVEAFYERKREDLGLA